ncbi:NfeD family protein [Microbacterium rhizosphaerae]|uniref:NfeD family protein n=1 Tax=Microbacterium rhizosphaerae TaxID=1678237 RepID=A0ABZ0SLL8_9MICO|nr:NfeD family protein [Microbacterium rhizosphaerae]WPR88096.1 NfeD family protein [Microbacterium rhizosphaerae]
MEFITAVAQFAWIGWIVLIAVFLVIEMLTLDFTFLMLAIGSVAGLAVDLFGAPIWLQVLVAAVVAALLIFGLRPPLLRRLRRGEDPTPTNVAALIGMAGQVVSTVTALGGLAKLSNGETWTARATASASEIQVGAPVRVDRIDGAIAYVTAVPAVSAPPEVDA